MLSKMIITTLTAILLTIAGINTGMAGKGPGGPGPGPGDGNGDCKGGSCELVELSDDEITDLLFMREEEKLARDSYLTLGGVWGLTVFANIAVSEQKHMDALKKLIEKYGLTDPVTDESALGVGFFDNTFLQNLYDDLMVEGKQSMMDALYVGGAIEEIDIMDLQDAIERSDQSDIITAYENLMCGSRNHLRAFVRQIEIFGVVYEPVYMSEADFTAIVDSPVERGCGRKAPGGKRGPGAAKATGG